MAMIDIDADWDPEACSLDEHRKQKLATVTQAGFGRGRLDVTVDDEPVNDSGPVDDVSNDEDE